MNAYELASGGEHIAQANYSLDNQIRGYLMDMASMLRQQADRISELEKDLAKYDRLAWDDLAKKENAA